MERSCIHNRMIDCAVRECGKCGWNPVVAEKRTKEIMKKIEEKKKCENE